MQLFGTIILVIVLVLLALAILLCLIGNYFCSFALDSKSKFYMFNKKDGNEKAGVKEESPEEFEEKMGWIKNGSNEVYIQSHDGLKLGAYEKQSDENSHKFVILCHGFGGNPVKMHDIGQFYHKKGYNLIFINQRARGISEGRYCTMGALEGKDVGKWVDYVLEKDPSAKIALHGISMGAATVMNACGSPLPENVVFAVEDCGFTSIWDIFALKLKGMFHLPAFPILNFASLMSRIRTGASFHHGNCLNSIQKSKIPMLFIHGTADSFVPYSMMDVLYEKATCQKQKLAIEDADHGVSYRVNPVLYFKTLDEFESKVLK